MGDTGNEDFGAEPSIESIKNNKLFRKWLAEQIGEREPRARDIRKIGSAFTLDLMNKGLYDIELMERQAISLGDTEYVEEMIWGDAYDGYLQWREDQTHRACIDKLKSDNNFIAWINNKLKGREFNAENYNKAFLIGYSDISGVTEMAKQRGLYESASLNYRMEGYALRNSGCISPREMAQSLRYTLAELVNEPKFREICKTDAGVIPQFRVVSNARYTGYAYFSNAPVINLNVTDLVEYNGVTTMWHILHECAHHVLADVSKSDKNRNAISEKVLKKKELRADCWAGYQISKFPLPVPDPKTRKIKENATGTGAIFIVHEDLKEHEKERYGYPPLEDRMNETMRCAESNHLEFEKLL